MTDDDRDPRRSARARAIAALALPLALAGCGGGDPKPGPEVAGGNAGVDQDVDAAITVLDVELEYPLDGRYEAGEDASLYLAISNTGHDPDTLIDVTGPDFTDVSSRAGSDVAITVDAQDTVYVGAEDQPALTLLDLGRNLRSSESIPVTLVFRDAGAVTVDAVVDAEGQRPGSDVDFSVPSRTSAAGTSSP